MTTIVNHHLLYGAHGSYPEKWRVVARRRFLGLGRQRFGFILITADGRKSRAQGRFDTGTIARAEANKALHAAQLRWAAEMDLR